MGLINIYDTISNKSESVKANGKLKDILPEINFTHSLILKAGNRLSADYEVTEEDVLYIRKIPAAVSATVLAGIAIGVSVLAIGVGVGAGIYANKKAEEAQKEMEKAQKNAQNLASQTQQLPFIRGAKNKSALGEAVQFLMGEVYNTPYMLSDGFYTIDGEDGKNSYFTSVFSCGYNSQKVKKILIGNEALITDNSGISGKHNIDSDSIYYDSEENNYVEVKGPGEDFTSANWNYKVKSAYSCAELKHDYGEEAEPVIVQAADNAYKIQVCIQFSALRSYNTESSIWEERTATVRPYWSNDGGTTWNEFTFAGSNQNTFEKNKNTNIRYVATKEFSAAESFGKNISIKVVKETPKAESNTQEDCYLLWYQTFCYDAAQSTASELVPCKLLNDELNDKVTKIGYQFIANDNTNDIFDELHCITAAEARIYENGSWSNTKSETRNPAAWLLEVLTSSVHDASRYDDEELYLPSFGALYDYCAENDFFCDGIISTSDKKRDVIEKILKICNSTLILNNDGLLEVVTDKEEQNPVALLNSENIVSFSFSKSMARKTDGTKVTFTNRNTWTVDTFYSMLDGQEYDYENDTVDSLAIDYVTDDTHAYKVAQRQLRQRQMQNREVKVDVGHEGDFYPLYSTVLLQLPQLLQGLNSSVIRKITKEGNAITKIEISDLVEFQNNKAYGVIIQATNDYGYKLYSAQVTGSGSTRELIFSTPLSLGLNTIIPTVGNHLSFGLIEESGNFSKITNVMKIYGIEPNGKDGYSLTLRDYDPEVYEYSPSGVIPEHKSNLTLPIKKRGGVTLDQMLELRGLMDNNLNSDMAVMQAKIAALYSNRIINLYKTSADVLTSTGITTTLTYNFSNNQATWGDPALANGWSTTVPQDLTNCWVTSASAYGKATTDVIQANEWARPVPYGASGFNTVTIHLYKRVSTEPQNLPTDLTYRFENGAMACSNYNGWTVSIPEADENKTPCWEIHATALSTNATDTIETSEWSEPTKIFTEGYSKEEIEAMIGERQNETPNITFSPSTGIFAIDEDGKISMPQSAYMDITVIQNGVYLDFTFGQIDLPSGVIVASSALTEGGQRLTFTVAQGTRLRPSIITIPINYVKNTEFDIIGDGEPNGKAFLFVEGGRWYGDCTAVADLPESPETNGFVYWNSSLDVQSTEEIVKGGVFYTGCYYTYNGTRWEELLSTPFGIVTASTVTDTQEINYTLSTVAGGRYEGGVSTVSGIPANPIIGDYFTWTGTDGTPYSGSGFTQLHSGSIYTWNGQQWALETSTRHMGTALPDVLSVAEEDLMNNDSEVILAVKKMIAWETVTKNIKVTGEAFINSTITANLTIGQKTDGSGEYGVIQSANYGESNTKGWRIYGDGTAHFRKVIIGTTSFDTDSTFPSSDQVDLLGQRMGAKYGTCATGASTAAKVVVLENFDLYTGAEIAVKFTYGNTASSPTLNVNNTGAIAISGSNWSAGAVVGFIYNGTNWVIDDSGAIAQVSASQNLMAQKIGYSDWNDMVTKASSLGTVVNGGYIRTELIKTTVLWSQILTAIHATFEDVVVSGSVTASKLSIEGVPTGMGYMLKPIFYDWSKSDADGIFTMCGMRAEHDNLFDRAIRGCCFEIPFSGTVRIHLKSEEYLTVGGLDAITGITVTGCKFNVLIGKYTNPSTRVWSDVTWTNKNYNYQLTNSNSGWHASADQNWDIDVSSSDIILCYAVATLSEPYDVPVVLNAGSMGTTYNSNTSGIYVYERNEVSRTLLRANSTMFGRGLLWAGETSAIGFSGCDVTMINDTMILTYSVTFSGNYSNITFFFPRPYANTSYVVSITREEAYSAKPYVERKGVGFFNMKFCDSSGHDTGGSNPTLMVTVIGKI